MIEIILLICRLKPSSRAQDAICHLERRKAGGLNEQEIKKFSRRKYGNDA